MKKLLIGTALVAGGIAAIAALASAGLVAAKMLVEWDSQHPDSTEA